MKIISGHLLKNTASAGAINRNTNLSPTERTEEPSKDKVNLSRAAQNTKNQELPKFTPGQARVMFRGFIATFLGGLNDKEMAKITDGVTSKQYAEFRQSLDQLPSKTDPACADKIGKNVLLYLFRKYPDRREFKAMVNQVGMLGAQLEAKQNAKHQA